MNLEASGSSRTFVLVHGGWHGGWCWRRVADRLRALGHTVFTPTLTGLGERAHLLDDSVSVATWVADITGVIEAEELSEVILVGHSLGGLVVSGVADKLAARLRDLVYLDASVVPAGMSPFDESPPEQVERRMRLAAGGSTVPPYPPEAFGVTDPEDAAWLERRLTPHPMRCYTDPIVLEHPLANGARTTYIACTEPWYPSLAPSRKRAKEAPGWQWREIAAGHDVMVTAPDLLTAALAEIAATPSPATR
jgi:pimeloyl-ACP methyl ester carboxylesterase